MTARGFAAFPKMKRRVATTWWGKAWVKALEDTALDLGAIRLGRRYAHAGVVGPITVSPGLLHAQVHDDDTVYSTTVHVPALTEVQWGRFLDRVAEQAGHIAALLDNDMPRDLVAAAEESGVDLLPGIGDLEPDCDCPGWELPCRHAAALAFQVGWLLDADPFVLLLLKGQPESELLAALKQRVAGPVGTRTPVVVSAEPAGQLPAKPGLPATTPVVLAVEPPPGYEAGELTALMETAVKRARSLLRSGTLERVIAIDHVTARSTGGPMPRDLRVTLNFHPGRGVLAGLARDGVYRSQFETGTSNGGLFAHPGGARWEWESRLFGGAYDQAAPAERPKYGALNHRRRPQGGAPRFGSAHLRLTEAVLDRTTFCYPDSVFDPVDFGTAHRMPLIEIADADDQDPLDDYIEAHVHGPVTLHDVEALVLDPSFKNTEVEEQAHRLGANVEWHGGFRLSTQDLRRNAGYRTPESVALGLAIAEDGFIDPQTLENAEAPPQVVKHLWHHLARFGFGYGR